MAYYRHELAVMAGLDSCGTGTPVKLEPATTKSLENARATNKGVFFCPEAHLLTPDDIHTLKIMYCDRLTQSLTKRPRNRIKGVVIHRLAVLNAINGLVGQTRASR